MKICLGCHGARLVCEAHPSLPWGSGPHACTCGAPGDPCPACNRGDDDTIPDLPENFVAEVVSTIEPPPATDPELEDEPDELGKKRPLH